MYNRKNNQVLVENLVNQLIKVNKKITTSESCTGGLLSSLITSISGSSAIFNCAWVTYSDWAKHELLEVESELLQQYGAVSAEVAEAMATQALIKSNANLAISITGFAGPTGDKIGLVFIGLAANFDNKIQSESYKFQMQGDRQEIREEACYEALSLALNWLSE